MSVPAIVTFVSTVAFGIQFVIFAYLYSSYRVRFFRYLLWAWAAYTLSKGLNLTGALLPPAAYAAELGMTVAMGAAGGLTLAAALAHRWDYRLPRRDMAVGAAVAVTLAVMSATWDPDQRAATLTVGALQVAAGLIFWPVDGRHAGCRGQRLLGGLLTLWGLCRIASQVVPAPPGTARHLTLHAVYVTLYFLSTFAVIIMVLERARSESDQLHARLREAERLAAIGELAAGMAHEIRNPLTTIVNATAILTDEAGVTADERAQTLAAVRAEARRLNRILSDFLRLARPEEPRLRRGDIGQIVNHVSGLIRESRSRAWGIDVHVTVDPAVPRFLFDHDQVTQLLWNVALNGVQAMNGRGRLSLEVRRSNGDVAVSVSDTGQGIPPDKLRRVFEPFYSEKTNGSGLGLAIAQRIVRAHGGRIDLDSSPGAGTRVTMLFPLDAR